MLKRSFLENRFVVCFVITVMCAVIVASSGCGRGASKLIGKLAGSPKPRAIPVHPHHHPTNPTLQPPQQPEPLIPTFEMPVTSQGSPTFHPAPQPQPLIRSVESPVAGQGTPRPPANAQTTHTDKENGDWVTDVLDSVTDIVRDGQREDRRPQKTLDDFQQINGERHSRR
jgi:hypothetical protein